MYIIILKIWFINLGTLGLRVLFLAASGQPDLRAAGRPAAAATADQPDVWRQPAGLAGQHVGPTARQPARPSPARYGSHQHYQQQQHQQQHQHQVRPYFLRQIAMFVLILIRKPKQFHEYILNF